MAKELERRGLRVERQAPVPIVYEGLRFEEGFRADISMINSGLDNSPFGSAAPGIIHRIGQAGEIPSVLRIGAGRIKSKAGPG